LGRGIVTGPAVVIIPTREWVRDRAFLLMIWVLHAIGSILIGLGMLSVDTAALKALPQMRVLFSVPGFPTSIGGLMIIGGSLACVGLFSRKLRVVGAAGFYMSAAGLAVYSAGLALVWSDLQSKHTPFIYATMASLYAGIAVYLGVGRADK
jgi:hypothetical protein